MGLKLNTASSGSVTIEPTNTASNYTLTVPATNATLAINGSAFSAYAGSLQSIPNATFTKLQINTKEFDTNSNFDATTNYRFTPTVAGYYQISGNTALATTGAAGLMVNIFKNGSRFKDGSQSGSSSGSGYEASVSALVYLNGSTDYVELYMYQASGGSLNTSPAVFSCYFQAAMIRSA